MARDATAVWQRSSIYKLQYQTYWQDPLSGNGPDGDVYIGWINDFYGEVYASSGGIPDPAKDQTDNVDGCYIMERNADGTCRAWRRPLTTSAEVETALAAQGLRLPTCDEWERACGAGATTLFRWGDDTPADFYPGEASAEDRRLGR